jgi:hypothetical protein
MSARTATGRPPTSRLPSDPSQDRRRGRTIAGSATGPGGFDGPALDPMQDILDRGRAGPDRRQAGGRPAPQSGLEPAPFAPHANILLWSRDGARNPVDPLHRVQEMSWRRPWDSSGGHGLHRVQELDGGAGLRCVCLHKVQAEPESCTGCKIRTDSAWARAPQIRPIAAGTLAQTAEREEFRSPR